MIVTPRKVLVVDADEALRRAAHGALQHQGLTVECAAAAPEAIRLGLAFEPRVLVTGTALAGETRGQDVAAALARHLGSLHVIWLMTPEEHDALQGHEDEPPPEDVFDRPVRMNLLCERVQEILATPAAS